MTEARRAGFPYGARIEGPPKSFVASLHCWGGPRGDSAGAQRGLTRCPAKHTRTQFSRRGIGCRTSYAAESGRRRWPPAARDFGEQSQQAAYRACSPGPAKSSERLDGRCGRRRSLQGACESKSASSRGQWPRTQNHAGKKRVKRTQLFAGGAAGGSGASLIRSHDVSPEFAR